MDNEDYLRRLASLCAEAFGGNTEAAILFMVRPHPELASKTPCCAAATEAGAHAVEAIIRKGLHGLPA